MPTPGKMRPVLACELKPCIASIKGRFVGRTGFMDSVCGCRFGWNSCGEDLLGIRNLFFFEHPAAGLIHTTVTQTAVVIDFLSDCGDGNLIPQALAMRFPKSLEDLSRIFNNSFRGSDQLAILIHLPTVSFTSIASPRRSSGNPLSRPGTSDIVRLVAATQVIAPLVDRRLPCEKTPTLFDSHWASQNPIRAVRRPIGALIRRN